MVKNPPAASGDVKRRGFDPWVGKIPNPPQYSHLENSMDRGDLWATAQGVAKSRTWLKREECSNVGQGRWAGASGGGARPAPSPPGAEAQASSCYPPRLAARRCTSFYNLPTEHASLRKICDKDVCRCAEGEAMETEGWGCQSRDSRAFYHLLGAFWVELTEGERERETDREREKEEDRARYRPERPDPPPGVAPGARRGSEWREAPSRAQPAHPPLPQPSRAVPIPQEGQ